jgi:hypothetical protein
VTHDNDGVERGFALHEAAQDADEITADSAANAAIVHLEDLLFRVKLLLDQSIVDTNLAELCIQSGRIRWPVAEEHQLALARTSFSITAIFLPCSCESSDHGKRQLGGTYR